jgi:3-methyladenine DNA glycosylase Tag
MLTAVKRWLTFHLVKVASQLDGELFMRLCEVAVIAHHRDKIEEAIRDALRLEQEHDYDYNHEREEYNGTTKPTTH